MCGKLLSSNLMIFCCCRVTTRTVQLREAKEVAPLQPQTMVGAEPGARTLTIEKQLTKLSSIKTYRDSRATKYDGTKNYTMQIVTVMDRVFYIILVFDVRFVSCYRKFPAPQTRLLFTVILEEIIKLKLLTGCDIHMIIMYNF